MDENHEEINKYAQQCVELHEALYEIYENGPFGRSHRVWSSVMVSFLADLAAQQARPHKAKEQAIHLLNDNFEKFLELKNQEKKDTPSK